MQALLSNKCIKYISFDEGSDGQTGEIGFYNGEVYDGEIHNQQPKGWGKLMLTDGSYYEGSFDMNGITEGKFVHFTRDCFEGKFVRDRFDHGTLHFCDGDTLKGDWGNERVKWILKRAEIYNEDNNYVGSFNRESNLTTYQTKGKEIFKCDDKIGFCVKYDTCLVPGKEAIKNLIFTADGTTEYENKLSERMYEKISYKYTASLPFTKIDRYNDNQLVKTFYQFCYGFTIETNNDDYTSSIVFKDLDSINGEGMFEMDKLTFKFKGNLRYKKETIGEFSIKKGTFGGIKLKINDSEFDSMNLFLNFIGDVCANNYGNVTVYRGNRPAMRKKSQCSQEVMKDMISDIKEYNNCVIM